MPDEQPSFDELAEQLVGNATTPVDGVSRLESDLALLAHANMADYVDRFLRALDADAIQPMDF
jgi:hypothetical protein